MQKCSEVEGWGAGASGEAKTNRRGRTEAQLTKQSAKWPEETRCTWAPTPQPLVAIIPSHSSY